jgi:hypothetical protein
MPDDVKSADEVEQTKVSEETLREMANHLGAVMEETVIPLPHYEATKNEGPPCVAFFSDADPMRLTMACGEVLASDDYDMEIRMAFVKSRVALEPFASGGVIYFVDVAAD